jgi:ribonuclease E
MSKKLLIDTSHSEEVRIAVVNNGNLDEFDTETVTKKQLKSNIYLAKVIRVEPSLQAAFVEYGGNKHGFLPFSEIHPDYFQIPVADREQILAEKAMSQPSSPLAMDIDMEDLHDDASFSAQLESETSAAAIAMSADTTTSMSEILSESDENDRDDSVSDVGDSEGAVDDDADDMGMTRIVRPRDRTPRLKPLFMRYKIQEVIKRRQILLIQVVKEERGNKGAALTTYLSLAGRYCVLMPNAGRRSGGISRKIDGTEDRKRLKEIISGLDIPEGMSLIVRTAGQSRNKAELKKDYEYLLKLWADIRALTLKSIAPCLIHEEGDLVKRAIRDVYDRDVTEVLVEGDLAYKAAKNLMKQMMPSHAKKVKAYKDANIPLFHKYRIEEQIEMIMRPTAPLPSGGYIVINPTEALVSIDVNSGRSTQERNINDTAFKTNIEAADEIARQLRLRDMAGLIVVDFIDMHDNKHIQQVERRLKDALGVDRARVQVGRISQFGLLEMSRQRLRPSVLETHSIPCHHCNGTGHVRSIESISLQVIRCLEAEALRGQSAEILVVVPSGVDLYLLNNKRSTINHLESRFNVRIIVDRDSLMASTDFKVETTIFREKSLNISELSQNVDIDEDDVDDSEDDAVEAPKQQRRPRERIQNQKRAPQKKVMRPLADSAPEAESVENKTEQLSVDSSVEDSGTQDNDAPRLPKKKKIRKKKNSKPRDVNQPNASDVESPEPSEVIESPDVAAKTSSDLPYNSVEDVMEEIKKNRRRNNRRNRFRGRKFPQDPNTSKEVIKELKKEAIDVAATMPSKPMVTSDLDLNLNTMVDFNLKADDQNPNAHKKKGRRGWLRRLLEV